MQAWLKPETVPLLTKQGTLGKAVVAAYLNLWHHFAIVSTDS